MADIKYYDVILKPVITEASMAGIESKKIHFLSSSGCYKNSDKRSRRKNV